MIVALVHRNLVQMRWLLGSLAVGVLLLQFFIVQIAAAFGPSMNELFQAMPPLFKSFVGAQLDELSFRAFAGFGYEHPAVLALGISFSLVVGALPARELELGLLDLWLARPLPRARYVAATVLTLVVGSVLLPLTALAGTCLGLATVAVEDEPAWTSFAGSAAGQTPLWLAIGGLTLASASGASERGPAAGRVVALLLVMFFVQALAPLFAPFESMAWLSLFHYHQPIDAVLNGLAWRDVAVLVAVFLVSSALGLWRFQRRDL